MQYGESFLILNIGEESVLENEMPTRVTWPGIVYMGGGGRVSNSRLFTH